ncbi:MAG: cytochrome c-type biogenesis protein CcmH [Halieaceae bacterium]|nr:cytochrome c-type biogenesis protein CcmH [Halieaceae bacterium]
MRLHLTVIVLLISMPVLAVIETYEFSRPELEVRYHRLVDELRCPKCQNQTIADSNAPISEDLRRRLYQELEAGLTDEEIVDGMVARYGEFVRYNPASDGVTRWLWLAPWIFLGIGGAIWVAVTLSRSATKETVSEHASDIAELLKDQSE